MDLSSVAQNVLSPAFLFFLLGFGAVLVRSDLEVPHPLPKLFSLYLLLSIGYTGGEKLATSGLSWGVGLYVLGAMAMARNSKPSRRADFRLASPATSPSALCKALDSS